MSNMELWNKVCTTDPKHTKKVEQRGGFTAIDAMYQIQTATEMFGAVGKGWGWSFSEPIFPPNDTVVIKCTLWHGTKENTVEHFGQKKLNSGKGADEDAFKKAGTDGLTKCLSYLGFNADVFLGKFDDNKYVEELKKKQESPRIDNKAAAEKLKVEVDRLFEMNLVKGALTFKSWWGAEESKADRAKLKSLDAKMYDTLNAKYKAAAEVFIKQAEAQA